MKGFVPLTKDNLGSMVVDCYNAAQADFKKKFDKVIEKHIKKETERTTVRKWYRLWLLPKARFSYDTPSIMEFSKNREYPIFEGCPFKMLQEDYKNSVEWIDKLANICNCQGAGEPIQIDLDTFTRISEPFDYHWCHAYTLCYTVR